MKQIKSFFIRYKIFFAIVCSLILFKGIWVVWATGSIGSFESEKNDILQRSKYLVGRIMIEPLQLINEMPRGIDMQFKGEWALYSCSMLTKALSNIAGLYPETKNSATVAIDSLIELVMSPELRFYDKLRWQEDPLENLDGDKSHISYLSHLAWMIGNYKNIGGDNRHDLLYDSICSTMNKRIVESGILNIPTYPDEPIYIPDMLVAIAALKDYSDLNNNKYASTVKEWISKAKNDWTDNNTGLLVSFLDEDGEPIGSIKGSYSALNCYYLTLIDPEYAKWQYEKLKSHFSQSFPISGIKEYLEASCWFGLDIDAGPILFNLSPSGTAFAIGSATFFSDNFFRNKLLKTAEIAGHTVKWNDERHYLLANIALVGEAITLAMRTNYKR